MDGPRHAALLDVGAEDYADTWARQLALVGERQRDAGEDTLILVEHPHVITLGRRRGSRDNVLQPDAHDAIPVIEVERGGDVTYHGPGQLVGYLVLRLDGKERDLHGFMRAMEQGLIDALPSFGVVGERRAGATGVWVGERKIASMGIAVRRWVTFHGFALNVTTELSRFSAINPCGFDAAVMTSMAEILGRSPAMPDVKRAVTEAMGRALGRRFR